MNRMRKGGCSARTIQAFVRAVKGFGRWLHSRGKVAANPLASLVAPNPESAGGSSDASSPPRNGPSWRRPWRRLSRASTFPAAAVSHGALHQLPRRRAAEPRPRQNPPGSPLAHDPPSGGFDEERRGVRHHDPRDAGGGAGAACRGPSRPVEAVPQAQSFRRRADAGQGLGEGAGSLGEGSGCGGGEVCAVLPGIEGRGRPEARLPCPAAHLRRLAGSGGVRLEVVQKRMRHSTTTLTIDTYGHLVDGQEQEACDRLEKVFLDAVACATNVAQMCRRTPRENRK